ncbi:MAG: methylenetetrahydrofolate reductase [Methanophagales archaeon]|nr:methylenetetrahydrofolate reductase [Methanophagales archaeon]
MEAYSNLMQEILNGKFVFTGELEPEKTTDLNELVEGAKPLVGYAVACNVTDNPQSMAYMSSLVASYLVQRDAGMETIYQLRCSDRNRLALTADVLGAAALGLKNILALTGDHVSLGDNPGAKAVYDLDAVLLTYMIRKMVDEGVDLAGKPIHEPPKLHVGVAVNPNADPLEAEIIKLKRKEVAGAEFVQTQVVYEMEKVDSLFEIYNQYGIKVPVLIGIFPMKNYGVADYFDKNIPGVSVPKELLEILKMASEITDKKERKEKYLEINLEYFENFVRDIMKSEAKGVHVMAVGYEQMVRELIARVRGEG